ncbi:MAG: PilZ domain-containing protein [Bryobacterales bacterium]|nr:PilZ domain-containing protein [Bryobacterales bacterium]
MIEHRKAKRFDLKLPVEVVRKSFQPVSSIGETKNLSASGVLFYAPLQAELGDPIEYIITFPTHSIDGGTVNLRCLGKVVRVEPNGSGEGGGRVLVAATLERYEFLRREG